MNKRPIFALALIVIIAANWIILTGTAQQKASALAWTTARPAIAVAPREQMPNANSAPAAIVISFSIQTPDIKQESPTVTRRP